jgi:FAD synthase
MHLEFTRRLRGEERYGSVEELVEQVHRDIAAVRAKTI